MEWQTRINSALGHKRTLPLLVPISAVTQTNDDAVGATAGNQRECHGLASLSSRRFARWCPLRADTLFRRLWSLPFVAQRLHKCLNSGFGGSSCRGGCRLYCGFLDAGSA